MSVYKFITRTVLHNFFYGIGWFFCNFGKIIKKAFTSFTFAPMIWVGIIFAILTIIDIALFAGTGSLLSIFYWSLGLAVVPTIFHWIGIDTNVMDKDRYEPKWAVVSFLAVTQFFTDIFSKDDEVEIREKAKRKKRREELKTEAKKRREEKKEAKKIEANKFDKFDIMEVVE